MNTNIVGLLGLGETIGCSPQRIKLGNLNILMFTSLRYDLVEEFPVLFLLYCAQAIIVVLIN
jgi:hypothetical protein